MSTPTKFLRGYAIIHHISQDDPSQVIEEINHKIRQLREESSIQRQNKSGLENEVKDIRSQYNTEKKKQQAIKRKLENVRNRIIELDNVEEVNLLEDRILVFSDSDCTKPLGNGYSIVQIF